jgi:hypothetical protein
VVEITPPALKNIGYKTYIIFAVFNLVSACVVYCFYPETAYLNLEAVDHLFLPAEGEHEGEEKLKKKFLQWDVVPRAWTAVNLAKKANKRASLSQGGLVDVEGDDNLKENTNNRASNDGNGVTGVGTDKKEEVLQGQGEKEHVELVK